MTNEQFSQGLKKNIDRVREYELGMDGTGGKCDCIGLIIGAIRLAGGKWTGTHGSNYAARNEMRSLDEIFTPAVLEVGDIVYKAREPGQSGYALPATYNGHPDRRDYYHVGVVTRINPLEITHCTSVPGGIKRDNSLGNWKYYGRLKKITEEADVQTETAYRVIGGTLKMRKGPGSNHQVIAYIPDGSVVKGTVIDGNEEWLYCRYGSNVGYCMSRFLEKAENAGEVETVRITKQEYGMVIKMLEDALEILKNAAVE